MEHIQPYLDYFAAHPDWAIVIIFLIAFGEALLIIGLFVPSTVVLVGAGVLVGTNHLPFWPVFLATGIGAIAGDQISYWAGRLFGDRLKTMWPLNRYPTLVAKGEDFVRQHGGKSIAIGRFVPGVKAVVPGIVGMFGMGQVYFASINFTSGLFWAAAHVFPGMLIGQGLALAGELSGRLVVVLLVLLAIVAIAGYLMRLLAASLSPYLNHLLGRLSAWARAKRSNSMRRFGRAVAPENPRSILIVVFAAIFVAGAVALLDVLVGVTARNAFLDTDVSVFNLMREMRNAPADELMIRLTMLGDSVVLIAVSLVVIIWLVWHRAHRAAIAAGVAIIAGKLFVPLIKQVIQRERPIDLYDGAEAFSFPSGHATMSALIFGVLAVLVSHSMGRWSRSLVYAISTVLVVSIAYSRVYLGAHWFSDVVAGLLFGAVMAMALAIAIEAIPPRRIRPLGLFGAAFVAFFQAGAINISMGYQAAESRYAPPQVVTSEPFMAWAGGGWKRLPPRRIDLVGRTGEAFAAQVSGTLDPVRLSLSGMGWRETPKWSWRGALPYLNPSATLAELPPRPALHEGLQAKLTAIAGDPGHPGARLVLRAFKTNHVVMHRGTARPVYLISLTREVLRHGFNLYAVPSGIAATAEQIAALQAGLQSASHLLRVNPRDENAADPLLLLASP
jgi:undecaprenyl-diphosphatase